MSCSRIHYHNKDIAAAESSAATRFGAHKKCSKNRDKTSNKKNEKTKKCNDAAHTTITLHHRTHTLTFPGRKTNQRTLFVAFLSAPASSSSRAQSARPFIAAHISAFDPSCARAKCTHKCRLSRPKCHTTPDVPAWHRPTTTTTTWRRTMQ